MHHGQAGSVASIGVGKKRRDQDGEANRGKLAALTATSFERAGKTKNLCTQSHILAMIASPFSQAPKHHRLAW
jgi:hypothetical protein